MLDPTDLIRVPEVNDLIVKKLLENYDATFKARIDNHSISLARNSIQVDNTKNTLTTSRKEWSHIPSATCGTDM